MPLTRTQIDKPMIGEIRTLDLLLFDFEGPQTRKRGCSSAGRAPALQAGGQGFDSPHLHHGGMENRI